MHQAIMGLLRQETQMLQTLVDIQGQQAWALLPLQSMENSTAAPPYSPLNSPRRLRGAPLPARLHPENQQGQAQLPVH